MKARPRDLGLDINALPLALARTSISIVYGARAGQKLTVAPKQYATIAYNLKSTFDQRVNVAGVSWHCDASCMNTTLSLH